MNTRHIYLPAYVCIAAVIQLLAGDFPVKFMAFPLNVLLAAIWIFLLVALYRERRESALMRFLLAPSTTIASIALFVGGCLVIGLFPQLSPDELAARSGILSRLGCYNFMESWIFVAVLFLLLSVLAAVTIRGCCVAGRIRWRFLLNHGGLWLALFAGFVGSSDTQIMRIALAQNEPSRQAYELDGSAHFLDYEMELLDFRTEYYPNGTPSHFFADVRVADDIETLEVNRPYAHDFGEDIYLTGYDMAQPGQCRYCIVQVVRQPWKYATVAGVLMMLVGAVMLFINGPKSETI